MRMLRGTHGYIYRGLSGWTVIWMWGPGPDNRHGAIREVSIFSMHSLRSQQFSPFGTSRPHQQHFGRRNSFNQALSQAIMDREFTRIKLKPRAHNCNAKSLLLLEPYECF